ncbi:hypothetical protein M8C21_015498 [Ambrosia artemisiifolia]|uniref:GRAM domain-containing protein n=1 Tax=Ambrosia artemisiifolia TaxID=4212 RepID=A0AAD5GX48_AMBAR|nr:hypothetical protein M8C21_015498 [Ambrosia artemisiifolia]
MVVLDLIRKVCRTNKGEKGKYIKIIISLLTAPSAAVVFECAGTLVSLSSAPTAIRAASSTYCQLLLTQSDNNVKLIVLDRLDELKSSHRDIMVDMIMDVLRALSSPNQDIRRKTLDIVLDLITPRNINEVVLTLKKEVVKTQSGELEKDGEYRQMLIQAIHSCAVKFPEVAGTVVHMLMDFLGDSNVASAMDVIVFVREIIETNPKLRVSIVTRLIDIFYQIRSARVCSCALWIISEYCLSLSEVESGIAVIKQCLGDLPFYLASEDGDNTNESARKSQQVNSITVSSKRPAILADGTYATQSAASETAFTPPTLVQTTLNTGNLRSLLLTGDFFLGAVVACTLTRLVLRLTEMMESPNNSSTTVQVNLTNKPTSSDPDHNPNPKVVIPSVETSNGDVADDRSPSTTPSTPSNRSKKSVRWSQDLVEERTLPPLEKSNDDDYGSSNRDSSSFNINSSMVNIKDTFGRWRKKVGEATKKAEDLAGNTWQHLKTAPSLTDGALGRIAQGTKVLAEGGYEKVFRQTFETVPEELLVNSYACYLSTSAGPVLGVIYVSTAKLAFCSDNPLSYKTDDKTEWSYYKVIIPLQQLKAVNPSYSRAKSGEKYIQVISVDGHEFWYMGFLNYDGAVKCLQDALQTRTTSSIV